MSSFEEVVASRRSVRGFFRDRPVAAETIRRALELAQRSPSNCNAQPWRVFIVSGEPCERLRVRLRSAAERPGEETTPKFEGVHRARQIACAAALYRQQGVERHDSEGRRRSMLRNFDLFDAPHLAIVCMDRTFGVELALDVGCWLQTFLLALEALGVQSCAQAALRAYPDVLRAELQIPADLRILCGVSFGYEDEAEPANRTRQGRAELAESVVAIGLEL